MLRILSAYRDTLYLPGKGVGKYLASTGVE